MTKQFIQIKKIADHGGKLKTPTHLLEVKNEGQEKAFTVGSFWSKEGQYGKYLAGTMKDDYIDKEGKQYSGYVVITKKEYSDLLLAQKQLQGLKPVEPKGWDGTITNVEDLPF